MVLMVSKKNGTNGSGHHRIAPPTEERTALEEVSARIDAQEAEEAALGFEMESTPPLAEDPLQAWKGYSRDTVTLDLIHDGLTAVSKIAEAAIEGGIKMRRNMDDHLYPVINRIDDQVQSVAAKVEATSRQVDEVDEDLAKVSVTVNLMRKDVQFLRDDVRELKEHVSKVPAIMSMLQEILLRLPA
jgi:hypothetical protein